MSEKGFTLVELALVLVIIGIIIAGALKATALIDNSRAKNVFAEVTALADAQHSYYERNKRYAGDSNNDGQIDFKSYTAVKLDDTAADSADADFPFNELKKLGVIKNSVSNANIGSTKDGGQMHFSGDEITDTAGNKTPYNMIVVTSVSCLAAYQLEIGIDGTSPDSADAAGTGSIRQIIKDKLADTGTWADAGTDCVVGGKVDTSARTNLAFIF